MQGAGTGDPSGLSSVPERPVGERWRRWRRGLGSGAGPKTLCYGGSRGVYVRRGGRLRASGLQGSRGCLARGGTSGIIKGCNRAIGVQPERWWIWIGMIRVSRCRRWGKGTRATEKQASGESEGCEARYSLTHSGTLTQEGKGNETRQESNAR